jgi:glutamate dehydrogenase (NAD(P)+)
MPLIGPEKDIPAPDVGTDEKTMACVMDTYSMHQGYAVPTVVTGKPISLGGSFGRTGATAKGAMFATMMALRNAGSSVEAASVAVMGFGKVGANVALELHHQGCHIVAVTDVTGGTHCDAGLDLPALLKHANETGTLSTFPGGEAITNAELLTLEVDVLIPAALESAINAGNAEQVRARIVVEGANAPTTLEADRVLECNGVTVVPDILANAGGVAVSYFEWVQGIQSYRWPLVQVNNRMRSLMQNAYGAVTDLAGARNLSLRAAAMMISVERVVEAQRMRGL